MGINNITDKINGCMQDLFLVSIRDTSSLELYLLKQTGYTTYSGRSLSNVKGFHFQVDSNLPYYSMETVNSGEVPIRKIKNKQKPIEVICGRPDIEKYLQSIGQWDKGIGFNDKLVSLLPAIEISCNNQLIE